MRTESNRPGAALAAMVVVVGLLAAACGSDRSEDSGTPGTTLPPTQGATSEFGDLPSPCGPGEPSGQPDQGVDATSVTIAFGDDAGYQGSPGLGHEASDAMRALIDWCNEQGGINGRQVVGTYHDAKITEANNVMAEACASSFMLVGQFFALPGAAEQTRLDCGLPTVPGLIPAGDLANAPLMVTPNPVNILQYNAAGAAQLAEVEPESVKRTGLIIPDFPAAIDNAQKFQGSVTTVGWELADCVQSVPITGVADFRPYMQYLKDCGAEAVWYGSVGPTLQNALDAAAQIDFRPLWITPESAYTEQMARWNVNGNGDRLYTTDPFVPLEHAPEGSANATYIRLVEESGGDVSLSGQWSASAFLLWATAAATCGDDLTRACVMDQLESVHSWTAGGLQTETDPGANAVASCSALLKLDGPAWVQVRPEEPGEFGCDPAWAVTVDPPVESVAALALDDAGVAHRYGEG